MHCSSLLALAHHSRIRAMPPWTRDDVCTIQLVLDSVGYARLASELEHTVTPRGTLFASFTGHHHAPLLLGLLHRNSACAV